MADWAKVKVGVVGWSVEICKFVSPAPIVGNNWFVGPEATSRIQNTYPKLSFDAQPTVDSLMFVVLLFLCMVAQAGGNCKA